MMSRLDDIDQEDSPKVIPLAAKMATPSPPPGPSSASPSNLDDLFGAFGISSSRPPAAGVSTAPVPPPASAKGNPLDDLFAPVAPSAHATNQQSSPKPTDDLLDFTRPVETKQHGDEVFFLQNFSRQSKEGHGFSGSGVKGLGAQPTLASLCAEAPSNNRVTARLMSIMNYYDVLGVEATASADTIHRQYKRKALEMHPDRAGRTQTPEEVQLFKCITTAHEVLMDPERRRAYDENLLAISSTAPAPGSNWIFHISIALAAWRENGISYLRYVNVCTETLHSALKEAKSAKYEKYSAPGFNAQEMDGMGGFKPVLKVPAEVKDY